MPLFYSEHHESPVRARGIAGVFRLDDPTQAAVQNGRRRIDVLRRRADAVRHRSRRDIASRAVRLRRHAATSTCASALTSTKRTGAQPWDASFGFSNAIELPRPARPPDQRRDRRGRVVEPARHGARGLRRLVVQQRRRDAGLGQPAAADRPDPPDAYSTGDGSSQGRMALWPDSTAHTVSASGSMALPARSRAFALRVGRQLAAERGAAAAHDQHGASRRFRWRATPPRPRRASRR